MTNEPRHDKNLSSEFATRSHANRTVQQQDGQRFDISDLGSRGTVLSLLLRS